ncbi:DUF4142 domain-containing protein [Sabulicella glaciei]|uniref:DUF4142 domain-containing protein n=1 Tax=Sabulicella glaciei TaxID=2984948 RepID=A0ABT3NQ11_9PROT|nr:DUF4142 domain-containing protein [Roseococcus sp. MDT2-1-1]MCW8084252.1 DUF4142 domain-containing protein [Roseococcus sp. MDT2-1-1]
MAVARRGLVLLLTAAGAASAQPRQEEPLRSLYGFAELQLRASRLAASRETREEVRAFATEMARWREAQLPRLQSFLEGRGIRDLQMLEDQETVWEGLQRLDFLALSRRYAEVQVQALELEIPGYERAVNHPEPAISALANEMLPDLRRLLDGAKRMLEAVGP